MTYRILLILAVLLAAPLAQAAPSADARREIAQLIASQQQALAHLQAQPQDALQRMAPRLGLSPEGVAAALAGMELPDGAANQRLLAGANPPLAQTAGQLMQAMWQQGLLPRQPDLGQLIDDRFTHTSAEQTP